MFVKMDMREATWDNRRTPAEEKTVRLGPFTMLKRGYQGEIDGITADGETVKVFEASVGEGGYCETCAYSYPDFRYIDRDDGWKHWEVVHWEITE